MKHRLTRFILTAGLSAFFGTLVVSAQDQSEKANIPFAFQTSDKTLAAGEYMVRETSSTGILTLTDSDGRGIFLRSHHTDTGASGNPRLVFRCYGKDRMLSEVWTDNGEGFAVAQSEAEKNLRRQLHISSLISVPLHR